MRCRRSVLLTGAAAVAGIMVVGSTSTAGPGARPDGPHTLMAAGPVAAAEVPVALPDPFAELGTRAEQALAEAKARGADMSFTLLDRETGRTLTSGDGSAFPIASVVKLLIADDLLMQLASNQATLTPKDRQNLAVMLRSSDDFSADDFWARGGGNAIVTRVADRYKLTMTTAAYNGDWWNTMSTTADLVSYYDKLLDGAGGLPAAQTEVILADLAASTPTGVDGYPQRFGIPDGLSAEEVAVKQGWMCCWGNDNQVHLSTGVIGLDRRYVIAVASLQPADDTVARTTVTRALQAIFPSGHI